MDFSKLTDALGDELKTLGGDVISGKTAPGDALKQGEEALMGKLSGLFGGSSDSAEAAPEETEEK